MQFFIIQADTSAHQQTHEEKLKTRIKAKRMDFECLVLQSHPKKHSKRTSMLNVKLQITKTKKCRTFFIFSTFQIRNYLRTNIKIE